MRNYIGEEIPVNPNQSAQLGEYELLFSSGTNCFWQMKS